MITNAESYFANLFKINQHGNIPSLVTLLPSESNSFSVDLNTRTVEAPEFLSVTSDHQSETVYFIVDRFFDSMDLSTTGCVIQYITADNEGRLYAVPYYDIETYHSLNKMIIPWCIEGEATRVAGEITYSIRFFKTDLTGSNLLYNLNTIPVKSKILKGIEVNGYFPVEISQAQYDASPNKYYVKTDDGYILATGPYISGMQYYALTDGYDYSAEYLDAILMRIQQLERESNVYWYTV